MFLKINIKLLVSEVWWLHFLVKTITTATTATTKQLECYVPVLDELKSKHEVYMSGFFQYLLLTFFCSFFKFFMLNAV